MTELIISVVMIAVAYITGHIIEARHYKLIERRERELLYLPLLNSKHLPAEAGQVMQARLVYGSVVISIDYFKRILAGLRNIFGGEVTSYETLIDRARREAVLRMKETARGADAIVNVRFETSSIGQSANKRGGLGSVEVLVYGTAIRINK